MSLILVKKHEVIYREDDQLYMQFVKIIFRVGVNSLQYSSPIILHELLQLTETGYEGLGIFKDKVKQIFDK
jgi:hypothetical protein